MEKINKLIPGLGFVFGLSLLSIVLNHQLAVIIQLEALTIGILLGMIYNNVWKTPKVLQDGIRFSLKKLLKVGIVLLGFKLNFGAILQLGPKVLIMVILFVPTVLLLANLLGKWLKADTKLATLIGVGSCICGASAIVAMSPCIHADDDDSVLAVSVVSFLGAIGVIFYSAIAVFSGMSDLQYGIWSGISLHGVAHAIAAAFARGDAAGEIGTFVKMARVLMLVPVAIVLGFVFNKDLGQKGGRVPFPLYVLYFIAAGIVASTGWVPQVLINILSQMSSWLILMAMISMGLMVDFKTIKNKGMKAIILGSILFGIVSPTMFLVISNFF